MKNLKQHFRSSKLALLTIFKNPFEHLLNILVLTLIITVCAFSISLTNSLNSWRQNNTTYPQIVIYLDKTANQDDIDRIEQNLKQVNSKMLKNYQFISKAQGLNELQQDQDLKMIASDVIDANNNPLPDVFVLNTNTIESSDLQRLNVKLGQLPKVSGIQMDPKYASKIKDLFSFSNQLGLFIEGLFILILSLLIYNVTRLQMLLKRDAILVARLIGASDGFIMRPLIHYAVWQITIASACTIALIFGFSKNLNQLFNHFNNLFGDGFHITQLPINYFIILWLILIIFTIFTVFLAVRWVFRNAYTD